jgi:hypothetical protein
VQQNINRSHLLVEVLAEKQDTGGNDEDNDILSGDISRGMGADGREPGNESTTLVLPGLQYDHQVVASFLIEVQMQQLHILVPVSGHI